MSKNPVKPNIYNGAFCENSENLSTIFTKNPISDVLFVKVNCVFAHQNFKPSLLINKTIVKKRKETVSFRFLTRNYRTEKTYNYGQKVVEKFTKLSKIGFSMECFAADFLWLASENFRNWL